MMQVSLVRVDVEGAVSVVSADSAGGVLRELQAGVGGMVDVVGLPEGIDMWVNDEGMYTESVNAAASLLLGYLGGQPVIWGAVMFAAHDDEGETTALSAEQIAALAVWCEAADADEVAPLIAACADATAVETSR